jgi:GntR family transcriptional regulator
MVDGEPLLLFRLDPGSGVPAYRQLVDQVDRAIRLGHLVPGDRLPSVRDVVEQVAINPNTVHRAYRELEHLGLVEGRHGSGTFVAERVAAAADRGVRERLLDEVVAWIGRARAAGLERGDVDALFAEAVDRSVDGRTARLGRMEDAGHMEDETNTEVGSVAPDRAGNTRDGREADMTEDRTRAGVGKAPGGTGGRR